MGVLAGAHQRAQRSFAVLQGLAARLVASGLDTAWNRAWSTVHGPDAEAPGLPACPHLRDEDLPAGRVNPESWQVKTPADLINAIRERCSLSNPRCLLHAPAPITGGT